MRRRGKAGGDEPVRYRMVLRGDVEDILASAEMDHAVIETSDGQTTLEIDVRDASHFDGIVDVFRAADVEIVSAEVLEEDIFGSER